MTWTWNVWLGILFIIGGLAMAIVGGSFLTANRQPTQQKQWWYWLLFWGGLILVAIGLLMAFWPRNSVSRETVL